MSTREEKLAAFGRLLDVQERLRRECPWDRKQTFSSLRPHTIEEVYELADAVGAGQMDEIRKELGDVMEHVVFYAMLGAEAGAFDIGDVLSHEADKLMFRHPFIDWTGWQGDPKAELVAKPADSEGVEATWEQVKQREKDGNATVLSGVPRALPALIKAYRIQDKARNVGFDWQEREQVWDKVREELGELEAEFSRDDRDAAEGELGDFLFSVVNAARLYHLNPDNALERTCRKFIARFGYVERQAKAQGRSLKDLSLAEMDQLWEEAKGSEE